MDYIEPIHIPRRHAVAAQIGSPHQELYPIEDTVSENGNTPFEVTLYQTEALTARNGTIPEEVVSKYLLEDFANNNRDIRIIRGLPLVDGEGVPNGCPDNNSDRRGINVAREYFQHDAPVVAADSNILIMDTNSGGCASIGGNIGAVSGRNINEHRNNFYRGIDGWTSHVQAIMHEIGHNMGWGHCETENFSVHPGWGDNIEGAWHKSPETACNGVNNACGEYVPYRQFPTDVFYLRYNECAYEVMEIEPKEPILNSGVYISNCTSNNPERGVSETNYSVDVNVEVSNTGLLPKVITIEGNVAGYTDSSTLTISGNTTKTQRLTFDIDSLGTGTYPIQAEITGITDAPI